jgi:hypothetical protein
MTTAEQVQDEISILLRRLADPVVAGESVKACIRRASMRAGLPQGQVKRLWYREWSTIPAYVADQIREKARHHDRSLKRTIIEAISIMQTTDPDFYREVIEAAGAVLLPDGNQSGPRGRQD